MIFYVFGGAMSPGKDSTVGFSENQTAVDIEIAMNLVRSLNGILALIITQGDESTKNAQLAIAKDKLQKMKIFRARISFTKIFNKII